MVRISHLGEVRSAPPVQSSKDSHPTFRNLVYLSFSICNKILPVRFQLEESTIGAHTSNQPLGRTTAHQATIGQSSKQRERINPPDDRQWVAFTVRWQPQLPRMLAAQRNAWRCL